MSMKYLTSCIFVLILMCKELILLCFVSCLESLYQPLQGHKSKLPELKTGTCLPGLSTSATA